MRKKLNPGIFLLAIWLILTGLFTFVGASVPGLNIVMGLLALGAGLLLLIQR